MGIRWWDRVAGRGGRSELGSLGRPLQEGIDGWWVLHCVFQGGINTSVLCGGIYVKSIVPGGPAAKEGRILQGEEWSHAGLCILWGAEPRPVGEGCSLKFLAHSHSDTLCKWWPLKVMVSLPGKGDDLIWPTYLICSHGSQMGGKQLEMWDFK